MAVPKKRTSKSKKRMRQFTWTQKASKEALKAVSIGKSLVNKPVEFDSDTSTGFKSVET